MNPEVLIIGITIHTVVGAIVWLINQRDERNFCRKASKKSKEDYIELQKAKQKNDPPIFAKLFSGSKGIDKKT